MPANGISIYGDITLEEISDLLKKNFPDKTINVENAVPSQDAIEKVTGSVILVSPLGSILSDLKDKQKRLEEAEEAASKAVLSIQTFHKQQQALFDEFVLLRQRYDEQKSNTVNILWTHCTKYHPDLRQIPDMKDPKTFEETDVKVGDYDVGEFLGEGQFATVKNCSKSGSSDGKEYALKIINKDRITSFTALMRVSNEIDNLKELQYPHIVSVRDVIHTENILYIITEKGGRDLFDFFDEHPDGVPEAWAKQITVCILKGVMFCHEHGVCHRDLKPENILLVFDAESETCVDLKLCDFGLSTKFKSKTLLSDFCGSPGFFAPEMITHGSYYGDKADVWSMGCILLELMAGHEKFCDVWMTAYDYEILQDKEKFTEAIQETVAALPDALNFSPELNNFILKFLALRVSQRPNTVGLCGHAWLDGALDEEVFKHSLKLQMGESGKGGSFPASMGSPHVSIKNLLHLEEDANRKKIEEVFNNLSEKERLQLEMYIKNQKAPVEGEETHHHQMHLPPITPATPSLGNAKKILRKGADIVNSNHYQHFGGVNSPTAVGAGTGTGTAGSGAGMGMETPSPHRSSRSPVPAGSHLLQSVSESAVEEDGGGGGGGGGAGAVKRLLASNSPHMADSKTPPNSHREPAAAGGTTGGGGDSNSDRPRGSLPSQPSKAEGKPSLMNSNSVKNIG